MIAVMVKEIQDGNTFTVEVYTFDNTVDAQFCVADLSDRIRMDQWIESEITCRRF